MKTRGFKPNENRKFPIQIFINHNLFEDWNPSLIDLKIIQKRIKEKIKKRPNWYKKNGILIENLES